jgi:hypothetical protein
MLRSTSRGTTTDVASIDGNDSYEKSFLYVAHVELTLLESHHSLHQRAFQTKLLPYCSCFQHRRQYLVREHSSLANCRTLYYCNSFDFCFFRSIDENRAWNIINMESFVHAVGAAQTHWGPTDSFLYKVVCVLLYY